MDFDTKLSALINSATHSFSLSNDKDFLKNARELAEHIAGCVILFHYEKVTSNQSKGINILRGEITYKDNPGGNKKLLLNNLIDELKRNEPNYPNCVIIKHSQTRDKIVSYLNTIRIHTNPHSHASIDNISLPVQDDALFIKLHLAKLLVWLFKEFINQETPYKLLLYIANFAPQEWLSYIFYSNGKQLPDTLQNLSDMTRKIIEVPFSEEDKMQALQDIDKAKFEKAKELFIKSAQRKMVEVAAGIDNAVDDYLRAGICAFLSDTEQALKLFKNACQVNPDNPALLRWFNNPPKQEALR
jgi:hypothetical protein